MKNYSLIIFTAFLIFTAIKGYSQSEYVNVQGGIPLTNIALADNIPSLPEGNSFKNIAPGDNTDKRFLIQNRIKHDGESIKLTITDDRNWRTVATNPTESPNPIIDFLGNGISIVGNGSNTPNFEDGTDFGKVQIASQTLKKTFAIKNTGTSNLIIGSMELIGSSDFAIDNAPSPSTIITPASTQNIVVSFSTTKLGIQTALLTINSNDSDEASYKINLSAEAGKFFYDSDGDGIYDDADIDDDNDGIRDLDEENNCRLSSGASQVDYKFLNETFGTGTSRNTTISTLYKATTKYCIEDGDKGTTLAEECDTSASVDDGEYTIASFLTTGVNGETVGPTGDAVSSWGWYAWANIEDHTPSDTDGRMAIFNADSNPSVFYETEINGILPNVPISYSFWVINIDNSDSVFSSEELKSNGHRILPEVTVNFLTTDRSTTLASFNTGPITRCNGDTYVSADHIGAGSHVADATYNTCPTSEWKHYFEQFITSETSFIVQFINSAPGGEGNNLAIDDIEIKQTLCDMDSDQVADIFDLDSDNDGIPDVVEANAKAASLSEGKGNLTNVASWVDTNGNGMLDTLENISAVDTDGDGTVDYLDLDSDNDGLFDVDESGAINTNDTTFQNGDGDISGDGVGDGLDTETFREKDSDADGFIEGYGDGILDVYDFHENNNTYANSFGNNGQGSAPLYTIDSDSDGIPDYKDPYNDETGTYDLDTKEIYATLPHTNGVLDDTTDLDGDGVMSSRDGDDTVFGSPRNLDSSYSLYFDGRNDYVEDINVISSGSASLMAFVKSGGTNTNTDDRIIAGQSDFYIRVNASDNTITAISEGIALTSTTSITDSVWAHVAVTTEAGGDVVLYINGIEEARNTSSSGGIISTSNFMIGKATTNFMIGKATTNSNYFKGEIDEVRVFNVALSPNQLKRMVYQELDEAAGFNKGKIIPLDISASLGSSLVKYYKMDGYQDDILDDKKTGPIDIFGAKMYNFKDIYLQRAPLPYITSSNGNWTDSSNWLHGNEWDITSKKNNTEAASIVHLQHNINLNGKYGTQGITGLIVDANVEFSIEADKGLYNSWYLKLDGLIDLENKSQLVQTQHSVLDISSAGAIERDQQGIKDLYTYKYWSSPVGVRNSTRNNNSYKMVDNILKNGTIASSPSNITFKSSGYDGCITGNDITIADYWIWKCNNRINDNYSSWQHVRSTGSLNAGEGFTMKGVANTGGATNQFQNYVFSGKPNNGDINLSLSPESDYLVGNPYPSALDADEFILDNISDGTGRAASNIINGVLYFWDHFASSTHMVREYDGGYASHTLMGNVPAIYTDFRLKNNGISTKVPGQYLPVGQGFFVVSDTGGSLTFKNSQRVFHTEAGSSSSFLKNRSAKTIAEISHKKRDARPKIKLMFDSPKGYHRQILTGVDQNATPNFDLGYDAPLIEDNKEDMFWVINDKNYVIQAVSTFDAEHKLPLGIKINKAGLAVIRIDSLQNIHKNLNIYLHDKKLNLSRNLKESNYEIHLEAGMYLDRFEITFSNNRALSTEQLYDDQFEVFYSNEDHTIFINNPNSKLIESVEMLNILGQSIFKEKTKSNQTHWEYNTLPVKAGNYILKLKTEQGIISKKVLIK